MHSKVPKLLAVVLACLATLLSPVGSGATAGAAPGAPAAPGGQSAPTAPTAPTAGPVAPDLVQVPLGGVDDGSVAAAAAAAPASRTATLADEGIDAEGLDDRAELLTAELPAARFDAVGVSWRSASTDDSAVWVRVQEEAGWTDWHLLPAIDIAPDAATGEGGGGGDGDRVFTEPLLTDGAQGLQVRIDAAGPVTDVRADLIDAGRSAADDDTPVTPAAATTPVPTFISRAQWGADESLRTNPPSYASEIRAGVIHHTATTDNYDGAGAFAEIRAIYGYHTLSLGWNDIAYNVIVDRFGRVFEGRAGGVDRPVIGAATGGFNTYTFSVSALGDFSAAGAPAGMLESIARVVAWKFSIHHVDLNGSSQLTSGGADNSRYPLGQVVTLPNLFMHRDTSYTACPGSNIAAAFGAIANRVRALIPSGLVHPAVSTTPRTPNANGSARVTAGMMYGGNWSLRAIATSGAVVYHRVGTGWSIDHTWPMTDGAGQPVPEGTYRILLESTQNHIAAEPFSAWVSTAGVFGNLEAAAVTPQGTVASGWAAVTNGDHATVAITVDGAVAARVPADRARPDVGAAYPTLGANRGFSAGLSLTPGVHLVCAWGERSGLQSSLIGCRWVNDLRDEPIGNAEAAWGLFGGVRVAGWALDRDATGPVGARVYIDGRHGGDVPADRSRPDVAAAYPGYSAARGFQLDIPAGPGAHHVCVNGLNVGAGAAEGFLGCRWVAPASGPPVGNVDAIATASGSVTVHGWTLDPDTTGPIQVHVYVDGAYAGSATAGVARPDLAAPFPFMGTAHGYAARVGVASGGRHTVCAYAINAGPAGPNPLLGCRAFG